MLLLSELSPSLGVLGFSLAWISSKIRPHGHQQRKRQTTWYPGTFPNKVGLWDRNPKVGSHLSPPTHPHSGSPAREGIIALKGKGF